MTISNWMMAIIKYENQLSVMSFPNVTSKTADAKPNPTTSNIIALIHVSRNRDNNFESVFSRAFVTSDFAREKQHRKQQKTASLCFKQRKIDFRFNNIISA